MSMDHKAFVFDYDAFTNTLAVLLYNALQANDVASLQDFIAANFSDIKDPYEGQPLAADWKSDFAASDIQVWADIALTKFYDPAKNIGLAAEWNALDEIVRTLNLDASTILLGDIVGPPDRPYDPGCMGSYFQSPQQVAANIARLQ